jgi:tRNA G37 N-methylase Trm5
MRAKLDNIAIVPASMLESKESLKEQVNKLPRGEVLLCHTQENTKQRQVLERVQEVFRQLGYAVTLLPMEQVREKDPKPLVYSIFWKMCFATGSRTPTPPLSRFPVRSLVVPSVQKR